MVSPLVAATKPMERTTRLARSRPPPSKELRPRNIAMVMNINDLDDDDSPDADDSAMEVSAGNTFCRLISLADKWRDVLAGKARCVLNVPGLWFRGRRVFRENGGLEDRVFRYDLAFWGNSGA